MIDIAKPKTLVMVPQAGVHSETIIIKINLNMGCTNFAPNKNAAITVNPYLQANNKSGI